MPAVMGRWATSASPLPSSSSPTLTRSRSPTGRGLGIADGQIARRLLPRHPQLLPHRQTPVFDVQQTIDAIIEVQRGIRRGVTTRRLPSAIMGKDILLLTSRVHRDVSSPCRYLHAEFRAQSTVDSVSAPASMYDFSSAIPSGAGGVPPYPQRQYERWFHASPSMISLPALPIRGRYHHRRVKYRYHHQGSGAPRPICRTPLRRE